MLHGEPCICRRRLALGRSTIIVSWINIVTDTVVQIHLCILNACNVHSCQLSAYSPDNAFSITILAL